jgi:hypothetical protein
MAKVSDDLASSLETENTGGLMSGFLAEEDVFDRRALWRLGSWGVASVGAVTLALYANQSSIGWRQDQLAAADLARQAQQLRSVAKESQNEARRLASAIDTLNGDRDRLYARVTVLEQGLDSVTGAIARRSAEPVPASPAGAETQPAAQNPPPAPAVASVATTAAAATEKPRAAAATEKPRAEAPAPAPEQPAKASSSGSGSSTAPAAAPPTPLVASKSMAPPDAAATKLIEPEKSAKPVIPAPMPEVLASVPPAAGPDAGESQAAAPKVAVQRTEFGVDLGGANSVSGLRALWGGLLKSRSNAPLTKLQPIIVVREGTNGLGMQLRLVAGPLGDAAAAAKICAVMIENDRHCETTVFDGQRLMIKAQDSAATAKPAGSETKRLVRRRSAPRRMTTPEEPPKQPETSTLSSLFGRR